jgi:hypothetical protein
MNIGVRNPMLHLFNDGFEKLLLQEVDLLHNFLLCGAYAVAED